MRNEVSAFLMGVFFATTATVAVLYQTKPPPCKADEAALSQINQLVQENGQAVKDAQAALLEQIKTLNSLPADKQEAVKILEAHRDAALALKKKENLLDDTLAAVKKKEQELNEKLKSGCPR